MIRVLLVSNRPANRAGLAYVIEREPGFRVHFADDVEAAIGALPRLRPDLLLLDAPLCGEPALVACHRLKQLARPQRVAIQTDASNELRVPAWVAGAEAVIDKAAPVDELFEQLRLVARGGRPLEPPSRPALRSAAAELPAGQRAVFALCVQGVGPHEISRTLRIDPLAVDATVRSFLRPRPNGVPS